MRRTALLAFIALASAAHAVRYRCIDIGGPEVTFSVAFGVSDSLMVAGTAWSEEGMVWTPGLGLQRLGPMPGRRRGWSLAVNEDGTVVGYTDWWGPGSQYGRNKPFKWKPGGPVQILGLLGRNKGYAYGVNEKGEACGYLFDPPESACVWDAAGNAVLIGRLFSESGSVASDINDAGLVCGSASTGIPGPSHAFRWTAEDGIADLGTLFGDTASWANGVNDLGYIVGYSSNVNVGSQGFIVPPGGQMQPYGAFHTELEDVNDSLQAVGSWFNSGERACLVEPGAGTIDLNTVTDDVPAGWRLTRATAVNSKGDVSGYAAYGNQVRAFLLLRQD